MKMNKILETPRLYLRYLQETDAKRMSEYRQKKKLPIISHGKNILSKMRQSAFNTV